MEEASNTTFDEFNDGSFPRMWPPSVVGNEEMTYGNETVKCNQYVVKNKTHIFYGGYEGIPENLLINFVGWILLLILFTILRKKAWNYGRLALVQKYDNRSKVKLLGRSEYNVWTQLFYGTDTDANPPTLAAEASYDFNRHLDRGTLSWISAIFKIKDEHILRKSGRDAVHYLSFQRHMIVYLALVCVVCITVVLPINFQGTLEGGEKTFGHTTISNLDPSSPYMWVHITLAFLFLPMGILFTRHHSRLLHFDPSDLDPNTTNALEEKEASSHSSVNTTIMITHVPRRSCHKDTLMKHFLEAYPDVEVLDLQFAYAIKDLILFDKERDLAHNAHLYCEAYEKETGRRLQMRPYKCGVVCCCCDVFGCPKVDAMDYYSQLEECLASRVETEKVRALQRPTGIAFVTLDCVESVAAVLKDHKAVHCKCLGQPATSSVSPELKPFNWIVIRAPAPSNIYWQNLSVTTKHWYAKAVFINLILFLILFFMTTPAVIINSLDFVFLTDKLEQMSPVLSEFFPTLLLWTMAALMPVLVAYSDQFMSHWTRSAENHSVMRKTFLFLLFMVIILPSLGLTSAKALVEWLADPNSNNASYRWECIFLPDNGAFFVNYIITSAFIGTTLELIRFPELFMYMIRLGLARSEAETASVRRAILYEFQFGVQYAWMLLIFAMTVVYSISCPLITPFGLVYMIMKHFVDKYNIYFAYGPSRISKNIHGTAVNFVMVSIVLLQLCLLFFSVIRQGVDRPRSIYSLVLLCITMLVFITHNALHWFKDLSPIEFQRPEEESPDTQSSSSEATDFPGASTSAVDASTSKPGSGFFVPDVLKYSHCTDGSPPDAGSSSVADGGDRSNGGACAAVGGGGLPEEGAGEEDRFYQGQGKSYGTGDTAAAQGNPATGEHYQNYTSSEQASTPLTKQTLNNNNNSNRAAAAAFNAPLLDAAQQRRDWADGVDDDDVIFDVVTDGVAVAPGTLTRDRGGSRKPLPWELPNMGNKAAGGGGGGVPDGSRHSKKPISQNLTSTPISAAATPVRDRDRSGGGIPFGGDRLDTKPNGVAVTADQRPALQTSASEARDSMQIIMNGQGGSILDTFAGGDVTGRVAAAHV